MHVPAELCILSNITPVIILFLYPCTDCLSCNFVCDFAILFAILVYLNFLILKNEKNASLLQLLSEFQNVQ